MTEDGIHKCHKCGLDAHFTYIQETGEEIKDCPFCGTGYSKFLIRNPYNGDLVLDNQGQNQYEYRDRNGFGVACFMYKEDFGSKFHAPEYNREEWVYRMIENLNASKKAIKEDSYVCVWDFHQNMLIFVYGKERSLAA